MEILFFWIKKFRHFDEMGVNLSSKFYIRIEKNLTEDCNSYSIIIKENPSYVENFFNKSNISNITGVIGKNGSGKSSILHYMFNYFPEGVEVNFKNDIVAYSYFEDQEEKFIVFYPDNIKLKLIDSTLLFVIQPYGELNNSLDTFKFSKNIQSADFIYYSFFLEYNSDAFEFGGQKNISTSYLILQDKQKLISETSGEFNGVGSFSSDLDILNTSEVARALRFMISEFSHLIPFEKPEFLGIYINENDQKMFTAPKSEYPKISAVLNELYKRNNSLDYEVQILNNISISLLANFLQTQLVYSSGVNFKYDFHILEDESPKQYVLRFFQKLETEKVTINDKTGTVQIYIKMSKLVPYFIDFFERKIRDNEFKLRQDSFSPYLTLDLSSSSEETLISLTKLYLEIKGITDFLYFKWRNLSTGEQSYLSFMSRFFNLKRHKIGHGDLKKELVILIDEGDAGYHPEWQRLFFDNTIDFLSQLFEDNNLQLIFTANAPFLTSDLPKSNILFIEKLKDRTIVIHDKENDRAQTFGSNIHLLFSDSFYMDGALVGAFAKRKIDGIIEYLNDKEINMPDEKIKRTIELIGEPLVRRKLQAMWIEKFGVEEEIMILQKRMTELLKRKNK